MSTSVLHETITGLHRPQQTYELQRTYEVTLHENSLHHQLRHKVRVVVHVDSSYPEQSRFYAEVWTDNGWREVARIGGEDPAMMVPKMAKRRGESGIQSGYVPMDYVAEKADSLEWAAELLLERAKQVLR